TNTGRPAFDALVVFSTWYPIGVMLLVFASRPLGTLIRQRAQERRK
ncbi:transposase, partial [Cronobacter sakazakii]|nr:transposase [Cronobacter sakazakii]